MTRRTLVLSCALLALLACGGAEPGPTPPQDPPADNPTPREPAPEPTPTWVTVPASDARIQYTGRVEVSATSAAFSYPGVSIKLRFKGDAAELLLKDQGAGDERTTNYYQVTLDSQTPVKLAVRASQTSYELGRNLAPGEHTLELVKLTESEVGASELQGFKVHGEPLEPPARPALRLELIGDSITCGYGNEVSLQEADNPTTGFHSVNENITRTYGWLTARALGAEAMFTCYSGRGVYRNNTGDTAGTLPRLYDRVIPTRDTPRWSFARYTPDLIVLNLGTNDFAPGVPDSTRFTTAYKDFVTRLRGQYPQARILCAVGPMMNDWYPSGENHWSTLQSWVSSVVKGFNDRGDARVHYLAFTPQTEPYGEDWHPSATTQQAMATRLTDFIRALP
ncbi:SGNH/GDSL hydrolase family protein [Archangium sp.]|uniref:SGNH/GDSL hydrolase family protein n=1 Tax=Archangium sp. TaxID=1872627 RepID=UPI003899A152